MLRRIIKVEIEHTENERTKGDEEEEEKKKYD